MCEDHDSFLIENRLPNLVELMDAKQVDDHLQIAADVKLVHLQLWPTLTHVFIQIHVGCVDELVIIEVRKEDLDSARQPQFEVSKQGQGANDCECLLHVGSGDFAVVCLHLLSHFDLLEVGDSKEHTPLALNHCFKVEEVVVLHLIMARVRHRMMDDQILNILHRFSLGITILYLSASLMVEVDNCQA